MAYTVSGSVDLSDWQVDMLESLGLDVKRVDNEVQAPPEAAAAAGGGGNGGDGGGGSADLGSEPPEPEVEVAEEAAAVVEE